MRPRTKGFTLYAYIATLFVALLFAFAAVTITAQYVQTRNMLLVSAGALFERIGEQTRQGLGRITEPAILTVRLLSHSYLVTAKTEETRLATYRIMAEALQGGASLSAAYAGYDNGDFIAVRSIDPRSDWGRSISAPERAAYLVQTITHSATGSPAGRYLFYDQDMVRLLDRPMPNYVYDPRTRGWFKAAMRRDGAVMSAPYLFFTTREIGITFSERTPDGAAAVGVDVTLDSLSDVLQASRATASSLLAIVDEAGHVLASSEGKPPSVLDTSGAPLLPSAKDLGQPVLEQVAARAYAAQSAINAFDVGGVRWQTFYAPLISGSEPISLAIATPQQEILMEADRIRGWMLLIGLIALTLATLAALIIARLIARSLDRLTQAARDFNALKFDRPFEVHSFVIEIDRLAVAMGAMKNTISRLLAIGALLGGEKKFDRLLDEIIAETIHVTDARGGIVYLAEPDGSLSGALARFDGRQLGGDPPPTLRPGADDDHPAMQAANSRASVEVSVTPEQVGRWYPGFEHRRHFAVIALPLKNRQGDLVGVLMLSRDPEQQRAVARADMMAFVEAVSGTAAVAIETNRLIEEQKRLMLAIIELLAGAIDAKSPYTSGHCQRVPVLTEMLAHAAEDATDGPFKSFHLSEEQWEELHIAGWLHDCGKLTSPEFVIDKATKLETIYDRLHEIRMRFEVIKREAEVACWKEIAESGLAAEAREARLAALARLWRTLDEEFALVAESNVGGEAMAPEKIARVKEIGKRTWTRTLDDRIGLSHEETERKARTPAPPLPALESLLADRPEHIMTRGQRERIAADNPWGFKVEVPELLYNRGEIYNLTVPRGTLTEEERFKINAHMIETIRMLNRLPLPRHLRNVPEIAGGHHEKMDGTGYPKRLRREEMSVPARMMAVADIFEALTAADRPYKKAKSLSESISIMARMRDNAHIDPEIFDLFLTSGVYRRYAERFMQPAQIDAVPIERYMSA
ncbi:HD domain-containing phosphohydrolase [Dongia sedimenti]|uniref:HD domain-containing phosphohydrolase n=1 Tax=Dongia sedimenti TaxID=3064282 RepID=A0ABU0YVV3_9PROT|nr:HD domain-containing phosphohydrolase [Rhodospirillaceae bacterium R-7]